MFVGSLLRWQKEHHPGITEQATRTPTPRQRDDVSLGSSLGSVDPDDSESDLFSEASTNGESALGSVEPDDSESDLFSEASTNGESADYTDILDDMTPPMEQHDDVHSTNGESADYTDIFNDMTPPMEPRTWRVEHDNRRFEVERIPYQHINYGDARATGSLCGLRRVVSDRLQTNSLLPTTPPPTDGTSLYLYRGAALSEYSPLEYAVCVSVRFVDQFRVPALTSTPTTLVPRYTLNTSSPDTESRRSVKGRRRLPDATTQTRAPRNADASLSGTDVYCGRGKRVRSRGRRMSSVAQRSSRGMKQYWTRNSPPRPHVMTSSVLVGKHAGIYLYSCEHVSFPCCPIARSLTLDFPGIEHCVHLDAASRVPHR